MKVKNTSMDLDQKWHIRDPSPRGRINASYQHIESGVTPQREVDRTPLHPHTGFDGPLRIVCISGSRSLRNINL